MGGAGHPTGGAIMTDVDRYGPDLSRVRPRLGERFPDVTLRDAFGRELDLHAARGSRAALVVFIRSASW